MRTTIKYAAATGALTLTLTFACAAPLAAWGDDAPSTTGTLEEAEKWAYRYLEDTPSLLSEDDDVQGWELLSNDGETWDLLAVTPDTAWYDASASTFSLRSGSQLAGLAELVNNGTDFSGKTIELTGDVTFLGTDVTPIGTAETPFNGTFDGAGHTVRGYRVTSTADSGNRAAGFGLFGACGPSSLIESVSVDSATVAVARSESSSQSVSDIGALVGTTAGSVRNCHVAATVDARSDVAQASISDRSISRVGGVAGTVFGSVENCSFDGTLTAYSATKGSSSTDDSGRSIGLTVIEHLGGVVGYLGTPAAHDKTASAATHGSVSGCSFAGTISSQTPTMAGADRFGQQENTKSGNVGGIVGYSQGSVTGCTSSGELNIDQGTMVGGIVGSLRSMGGGSATDRTTMDTGSEDDQLVLSGSSVSSEAKVNALHAAGGIVGSTGSYTEVTGCSNAADVTVSRWNKPTGGGIAGSSHGDISFCYNTGSVTTTDGAGYYVAGIAGMLLQYRETDGTPNQPTPEVYGCYNAGIVYANADFKSASLVAQNDGRLHDCLALEGTSVDKTLQVDDSSAGTLSNCSFVPRSSLKSSEGVAFLNKLRNGKLGWGDYFLTSPSENNGYPVLQSLSGGMAAADLGSGNVSATLSSPAVYTGGEAVPTLSVTFNGTELVQDADFRVVPQKDAVKLGSGYRASIEGIGAYRGTVSGVCSYSIEKGDLSACDVSIEGQRFDYEKKTIDPSDITVTDVYGNVLPSSWYTFSFKSTTTKDGRTLPSRYLSPYTGGKDDIDMTELAPEWSEGGPIHYGYYPVEVKATSSAPYTGTALGDFKVEPADLTRDVDVSGISYGGQTYAWDSQQLAFEDGSPVFEYTGDPIKPDVPTITYKGRTLVEGTDYRLVYGNTNADTDSSDQIDNNVGSPDANKVGCVTVRFIGGGRPSDFTNFANLYFIIHGQNAPAPQSIADCTVVAPASPTAENGGAVTPVKVYAPDGTLVDPANYKVEYANNTEPGTASFTVRGTQDYTGTYSGTFTLYDRAEQCGWDDVDPTAWYGTSSGVLKFAKESKLIYGVGTSFLPYDTLTRAQAATILWRFAAPDEEASYDQSTAANETGMADVEDRQWYTGAANWATRVGVINGVDNADGTRSFDPYGTITREQICAIIANFAETQNGADLAAGTDPSKLAGMTDAAAVSGWATDSVAWALTQGVISGVDNGDDTRSVAPAKGLARIEMAAIMMNCVTNEVIR